MQDKTDFSPVAHGRFRVGGGLRAALLAVAVCALVPAAALAEDASHGKGHGVLARLARIEAALAEVKSEVRALKLGHAAQAARISANASDIAANAAAIAADAAAIAANTEAIGALDSRVSNNSGLLWDATERLEALDRRVAELEEHNRVQDIPVYRRPEEFPTDGSVYLALFQPEGGIWENWNDTRIADQWLMVYDGVSPRMTQGIPGEDGSLYKFPVGWYPAANGASEIEGLMPITALSSLRTSLLTYLQHYGIDPSEFYYEDLRGDASIGERVHQLALLLSVFYVDLTREP